MTDKPCFVLKFYCSCRFRELCWTWWCFYRSLLSCVRSRSKSFWIELCCGFEERGKKLLLALTDFCSVIICSLFFVLAIVLLNDGYKNCIYETHMRCLDKLIPVLIEGDIQFVIRLSFWTHFSSHLAGKQFCTHLLLLTFYGSEKEWILCLC